MIKTANLLQNSIPGMIVRQEGLLELITKVMVDYLLNTDDTYNWGTGVIINTGHVNSSPILMAVDRDTCNTCGAERGTMPDVNITGASKLFSARKFVTSCRNSTYYLQQRKVLLVGLQCTIKTDRPPIQQPLCRIPFALESTVRTVIQKVLEHCVIQMSHSSWSSPVAICIQGEKEISLAHKQKIYAQAYKESGSSR